VSAKPNIKSAPGQCKLRVVETETRDAIVTDVPAAANGQPHNARTIAYVAIGAESWGPLLAAAPDLLEALRAAELCMNRRAEDIEKDIESGWLPREDGIARRARDIRNDLLAGAAAARATIAKAGS
jgi:hypothetical protein